MAAVLTSCAVELHTPIAHQIDGAKTDSFENAGLRNDFKASC